VDRGWFGNGRKNWWSWCVICICRKKLGGFAWVLKTVAAAIKRTVLTLDLILVQLHSV
jgi:hypothetical protein